MPLRAAPSFRLPDLSDLAYISILAALAAIAALSGLVLRNSSHDELLSLYFSRPEIAFATVVESWKVSTHVPGYYAALRGWNEVFGAGRISSRLLSLLGLPLAVRLIWPYRTFMGSMHFRIFSALLILSPAFVYYASEARMYIFLLAGTAAVFLFGFRMFDAPQSVHPRLFLAFALSALLLSMTDYFGLIFAGATVVVLLVRFAARRPIILIPLLALLAFIAVLPAAWTWFAWSGLHPQTGGHGWLHFEPVTAVRQFAHLIFSKNFLMPLVALGGLVVGFRTIVQSVLVRFALAVGIVGFSIAFAVSLNTPVLMGRTLLVFAIPVLVVVGTCLESAMRAAILAWPRRKSWAVPAVALLIAVDFAGAIHKVDSDNENFRGPSRFMAKAGCARAEILTDITGADVPGTQGEFVVDYYFVHELHVPSPRFLPYNIARGSIPHVSSRCAVKAFVWLDHVPPDAMWTLARRDLGAPASHRIIRYANAYLLVQ